MWALKTPWLVFFAVLISFSAVADVTDLVDELREIPSEAELITRGLNVPLSEAVQVKLVDGMKTLLKTCKVDSKTRPSAFNKFNKDLPFSWQRATDPLRNTSYISVSLGKLEKLRAGNKSVYAKSIMLETPNGNWPRKFIAVSDGRNTIQFTKCSGLVVVDIICMKGVKSSMPKNYSQACKVLPKDSPLKEDVAKEAAVEQ